MKLNRQQTIVSNHKGGAALTLAPPGSGKTAAITHRAANLIKAGLPPKKLLLVTFSKKACDEMSERISRIVEEPPTVFTLHKLGKTIVIQNPEMCDRLAGVSVEERPYNLYRQACHEYGIHEQNTIKETWRRAQSIRFTRTYQLTGSYAEALVEALDDDTETEAINTYVQIYKKYDALKKKKNVIDMEDMIILAAHGLKVHSGLRRKMALLYPFIIVDEAQDTNWGQYNLVSRIAQEHKNLMLVGDDDQTVYKFQGADPEILKVFKNEFGARLIQFTKNYRSTPEIVSLGDMLIKRNKNRFPKDVYSMNAGENYSHPVYVTSRTNPEFRGELTSRIKYERSQGIHYKDMAILYRTNALVDGLVEALEREKIPFQVLGALRSNVEPEIDAFAYYLKLKLDQYDISSFKSLGRLYGLSSRDIDRAVRQSQRGEEVIPPIEACTFNDTVRSFSAEINSVLLALRGVTPQESFRTLRSLPTFAPAMMGARRKNGDKQTTTEQQNELLDDYENRVDNYLQSRFMAKKNDIEQLRNLASAHLENDMDSGVIDGVTLSSMHKAKGLEWPSVHVVGLSDGIMPVVRNSAPPTEADIESERSVLFVAITRAEERLYMYHSTEIKKGDYIIKKLKPSRFLSDMGY